VKTHIAPATARNFAEEERQLVASGVMKMPEQPIDWKEFWALPAGHVPHEIAVKAVIESRQG
jgi:hypothetical protein